MKDEENNDIGHFFSAHLNEGNIPFEEADWEAMEEKLNEFDGLAAPATASWQKWGVMSSLALLLFLAGWFSHQWIVDDREQPIGQIAVTEAGPEEFSAPESATDLTRSDQQYEKETSGTSGSQEADAQTPGVSSDKKSTYRIPLTSDRQDSPDEMPRSSAMQGSAGEKSQTKKQPENMQGENSPPYSRGTSGLPVPNINADQYPDQKGNSESAVTGVNETARSANLADQESETGRNADRVWLREEPPMPESLGRIFPRWTSILPAPQLMQAKAVKTGEGIQLPAFEIGVTVAPDLNGVGAAENYKLAWEAGLSLYYNLSQKWRLSTGVYYAKKAYQASGTAYSPPEGYWDYTTNGIVPEEVDARCGILDIPVNVTYVWNPNQKLRFTTTAGISNYLILNEDYQYSFGYTQPYTGYDGWSTEQNSAAFLGMVNAGIGAEWSIRPGLHLAVEPYFKIPLKEIGFGRVPLNGTGVYFTLRKQLNSH